MVTSTPATAQTDSQQYEAHQQTPRPEGTKGSPETEATKCLFSDNQVCYYVVAHLRIRSKYDHNYHSILPPHTVLSINPYIPTEGNESKTAKCT